MGNSNDKPVDQADTEDIQLEEPRPSDDAVPDPYEAEDWDGVQDSEAEKEDENDG
jgi:hypothetical protein